MKEKNRFYFLVWEGIDVVFLEVSYNIRVNVFCGFGFRRKDRVGDRKWKL